MAHAEGETPPDQVHRDNRPLRGSRLFALSAGAFAFLLVIVLGEMTVRMHSWDKDSERHLDAISRTAVLRAKIERELNSVLYLSSGLGSYLIVRNDTIQRKEINDILARLHRSSRNVRNFGIAVGYRLSYVYPLSGNEAAIGLYYPDEPDQWPTIGKTIASGAPALAGPVELIQGGHGLIYRVPLFIGPQYWGLLSTVIDADALFGSIDHEAQDSHYQFALRGKDGEGLQGGPVWGDIALFDQGDVVIQEIDIPGGTWAIAVKANAADQPRDIDALIRLLSGVLGALIAWMLHALIRSRTELAHRAMYDVLTGLPNRILLEDRAHMAFARQQRNPEYLCALLFIDLDGFKNINDAYGHKAGDAVLRATAERAKAAVRVNDTIARWGGDEFIVLLENVTQEMLDALMARLRANIEAPIEFEGRSLTVGVSMGMAIHPETGADLDETLRIADQRMYEDKLARRQPLP
jgi:diguanylate cyclase (GGDEF)-like protein